MRTVMTEHWHHLPSSEVLELLDTDPENGLDILDVAERQRRYGSNELTQGKGDNQFIIFLRQFHQPLVYILLAAAAGTALLSEFVDMAVILAVVLLNSIIGFVQESKALKAIEALSQSMESETTAVRAGKKKQIKSKELIPGDIVSLQSGDRVPADLRMITIREMQVDESALTGESVPVQKQTEKLDRDTVLAEHSNMAYSSTLVTYGTGIGAVTGTGDDTEIGQINEMTVKEIFAGQEKFTVSGVGYAPEGILTVNDKKVDFDQKPALSDCLKAGLLCNDSRLVSDKYGWRVEGDPTEGALITSSIKAGFSKEKAEAELPRVDAIPFESQHQYMATMHRMADGDSKIVYIKGSVESLLPRCKEAIDASAKTIDLDEKVIHNIVDDMAAKGMRVLAFARREIGADTTSINHGDISSGLTFLGLQGMIDPPRPEAIQAVNACQSGVKVKMITGDHTGTATAIARELKLKGALQTSGAPQALSGKEIEDLSDEKLIELIEDISVFARVAPAQKLRLVEAFQAKGHVAAMTGDGVNDAPALRQADIGVAMGIAGTEVAKETADMVLTDDNFATIEAAVEEGRGVYDNLIKFITWTLPTNLSEGLVILVAIFAGLALPILPLQILWVNMATAVFLGAALAFEAKEPGIMNRPPRRPKTALLTKPLVWRVLWVGILLVIGTFVVFELAVMRGKSVDAARTAAVNLIVFGELFYLFNCRSLQFSMFKLGFFTNGWLLLGVLIMVFLQLIFTYAPFMNTIFDTAPIDLSTWIIIIFYGFIIYLLAESDKWWQRRKMDRKRDELR